MFVLFLELGPRVHWSRDELWAGALRSMGDRSGESGRSKNHTQREGSYLPRNLGSRGKRHGHNVLKFISVCKRGEPGDHGLPCPVKSDKKMDNGLLVNPNPILGFVVKLKIVSLHTQPRHFWRFFSFLTVFLSLAVFLHLLQLLKDCLLCLIPHGIFLASLLYPELQNTVVFC